jgi:hypothetical protein
VKHEIVAGFPFNVKRLASNNRTYVEAAAQQLRKPRQAISKT